jgi:hypothetical protein
VLPVGRKMKTEITVKEILKDKEEHVDDLEAQLGLIEQLGLQNYLIQTPIGKEKKSWRDLRDPGLTVVTF